MAGRVTLDAGHPSAAVAIRHGRFVKVGTDLTFNAILRWDGVTMLAEGLEMIRQQALRTPK
ncbi:MAG: hypothetical protein OXI53_01445 [Nitrospira sp.]|nr:hypothetical protein [Nitrospira sp.]MDE0487260.1 hypothetical protein [Nitrospira sp.]